MIEEHFDAVVIKTPRGIARVKLIRGNAVWSSDDNEFSDELNTNFGNDMATFAERMFGKTAIALATLAVEKYGGDIIKTKSHNIEIPDDVII